MLIIIVALFIGGFAIGSIGNVPKNATVYINKGNNIYYSPLGLTQEKIAKLGLKRSTIKAAETLGFKMSEEDIQNGYFQQEGRSLSGELLEKLGVLPKLKKRIDSQGNWLY